MRIFTTAILSLCALMIAPAMSAQRADSLPPLTITARFDGTLKAKFEASATDGMMRFNVRNSRVGLRGELGQYVSYRFQVELSAEGNLAPLDLYGTLKPMRGLSFNFGQTQVPFENTYVITPSEMMFANRAFIGKFFSPGSRDLGVVGQYKFSLGRLPLEAQAGMFNGGKINDPQWTDAPSYAFRLIAGRMDGLRASAKMYRYRGVVLDQLLLGADLHYSNGRLKLETEVMNRRSYNDDRDLLGAYAQGAYAFPLAGRGMFHNLTPALRWDAMGYPDDGPVFDVNRITAGLDFGLSLLPYESVLRLNFEQYFVRKGISPVFFKDRDLHVADNKVTLELVIKF